MAYRLELPDLGEGVVEGEIVRWLVAPGDEVDEDTLLVEVLTDKASVEIPSPVAGRVVATYGEPGTVVSVGTALVEIETADEPAADVDASDAERPAAGEPVGAPGEAPRSATALALPAVRRLARELGVDLGTVRGSGPDGRITEEDVRAAAAEGAAAGARAGTPLTGVRRTIARRLSEAAAVPTVTAVDAADFTDVRAAGIGLLAATAHACVLALKERPALNAWFRDERVIRHDDIHLGIATETSDGLVVPVVRDADERSLADLAHTIDELASAAREGRLGPSEMRGSTITITSAGRLAGEFATPLLNLPEVAIVGLYRVGPRPVVRDGEVVVREVGNLSITFDHRAADGRDAARLMARIVELIETTDWQDA